jgi:hypothetical protein
VFLPVGEPQCNGSVDNFNGWFHEPQLQRKFHWPGDLRRELARLQEAVHTRHVHPRWAGKTPAQHRRGLRLHQLPASFVVPTGRLPLAAGRRVNGSKRQYILRQRLAFDKGATKDSP